MKSSFLCRMLLTVVDLHTAFSAGVGTPSAVRIFAIMQAVMEKAGMETPAQSIIFSLPVTDAAGLNTGSDENE